MICRKCQAEIPDTSPFCNRCGAAQAGETKVRGDKGPEEMVWKGRYSARAAAHLWLVWALWIAAVATAYFLWVEVSSNALRLTILGVALLPGVVIALQVLVKKLSIRYRMTDQRFFRERGLLSRHVEELELIRVDDVSVSQNLLQRVFDVGQITLFTTDASDPKLLLEGIEGPIAVKERIRELVRARRNRATFLERL